MKLYKKKKNPPSHHYEYFNQGKCTVSTPSIPLYIFLLLLL
jgi:hypothetical protein